MEGDAMKGRLTGEFFCLDRWFQSSAIALPLEARGLYREMLSRGWLNGGWLPNNHDAIRRLVGASEIEWRRSWPLVEPYWRVDGARLVNDTQLKIYGDAKVRADRATHGGAARGAQLQLLKRG